MTKLQRLTGLATGPTHQPGNRIGSNQSSQAHGVTTVAYGGSGSYYGGGGGSMGPGQPYLTGDSSGSGLPTQSAAARASRAPYAALPPLITSFDDPDRTLARMPPAPYPDPSTPTTPTESVMALYDDPDNLPRPRTAPGEQWLVYGERLFVEPEYRAEHEILRTRMASTEGNKKYLAHLEQGRGPIVYLNYFSAYSERTAVETLKGHPLQRKAATEIVEISRNAVSRNMGIGRQRVVVCTIPVDEGSVTARAGLQSAVSIGMHEVGHAARAIKTRMRHGRGRYAELAETAFLDAGAMKNRDERFIIQYKDNPNVKTFDEGPRDAAEVAGRFRTDDFRSTQPANPDAHAAIAAAQPGLRDATRSLDSNLIDVEKPGDTRLGRDLHNARVTVMRSLFFQLQDIEGPSRLV